MADVYLEIANGGDIFRLEPLEVIKYASDDLTWDKNWVKTKIMVKGGVFSGQYSGDFMTTDFEKLKKEFQRLYDDLRGSVDFSDREGYLILKIKGDGIGHFEVNITACDRPDIWSSKLSFSMDFDQTYIKELIGQLEKINKRFPVIIQ